MVRPLFGPVVRPIATELDALPERAVAFLPDQSLLDQSLKCVREQEPPPGSVGGEAAGRADAEPAGAAEAARLRHLKRLVQRTGRPVRAAVRMRRTGGDEPRCDDPAELERELATPGPPGPGRPSGAAGLPPGAAGRPPSCAAQGTAAARLAAMERIARIGYWEWDLRRDRGCWSDEIYRLLGLGRDAFEPTRAALLALLHPADIAAARQAVRDVLRGRRPCDLEFRVLRPDGLVRHVHVLAEMACDAAGRVIGMVGTAQDVTLLKRAEFDLRARERRLQRAQTIAGLGWFEYDLATGGLTWSEECCRIWGRRPDEVAPKIEAVLATLHPADRGRIAGCLGNPAPAGFDRTAFRVLGPDGTCRDVACEGEVETDAEGRPVRLFGICRDVTGWIAAQEALLQAKGQAEAASAAKTRFLAAASHDLRQPLQAGILFHDILARRSRDPELGDIIAGLGQSLEAQQAMLGALLDMSRLDAGAVQVERQDFPILGLLDRLAGEFARQAEAAGLELRRVACSAVVHSDPHLLERMLRNLLSNAVKFTDAGRVLLGCRREGALLRVQVHDTGIGIPPDQTHAVFEEFRRLDTPGDGRDGLGLGLAIVNRLATLLGHPVRVRSTPGRGTLFEILVPLALPPAAPAGAAPGRDVRRRPGPAPAPPHGAGRIALIEDDAEVLRAMRLALEAAGHEVAAGLSVDEALPRLDRGRPPDVIVADYHLRHGATGAGAIGRLRDWFGRAIPAILITGDTSSDRLREAEAGGFRLLCKPIRPAALTALIDQVLRPGAGVP